MAGAQPAPILAPAVIWSGEALRKLRTAAVDGLMALPQRGMEVGGLLLGSVSDRAPYLFSVEDICPVHCEHRFGPGFALSEDDHERLREQLASVRAFGEHCVIGFFRSRTGLGGRAEFDDSDRELLDNYFDDPSHVFLAIHPRSYRRCDAAMYFWTGDRLTTTGRVCELDELESGGLAGSPETGGPDTEPVEPTALERPPAPEPEAREEQPRFLLETSPPPRRISVGTWFIGLLSGLALAGFLVVQFRATPTTPPQPRPPAAAAEKAPPPDVETEPAAPPEQAPPEQQPEPIARRALSLDEIHPDIPESIRARMTGPVSVTLRVDIDETGRAVAVRPAEYSDGIQRYVAQRAAEAVREARFRPAESASGRPLPSSEAITVTVEPR